MDAEVFANLQCIVGIGDLPLTVIWEYPEMKNENSGVLVSQIGPRVSLLTIPSVTSINVGNYTCIASNSAGKDVYTTPLTVNGSLVNNLNA